MITRLKINQNLIVGCYFLFKFVAFFKNYFTLRTRVQKILRVYSFNRTTFFDFIFIEFFQRKFFNDLFGIKNRFTNGFLIDFNLLT